MKVLPEIKQTYQTLAATVEKFISRSAYFYLYFSKVYENYAVQPDVEEFGNTQNTPSDMNSSKIQKNQKDQKAPPTSLQVINWAKYLKKYQ